MRHNEPVPIRLRGRDYLVFSECIARYGDKMIPVEMHDARHFSCNGRPILPPPDWKFQVSVLPVAHTRPRLVLVR